MSDSKDVDKVRAGRIATLPEAPGFLELIEDLEAAEARAWSRMQSEWRQGRPVDQREVDEMRGVSATIRKLRRGPERAAKTLELINEKEPDLDGV